MAISRRHFYLSYFEDNSVPPYLVDIFKKSVEYNARRLLGPIGTKKARFLEKVCGAVQFLSEKFPDSHVLVVGSFVSYLEGLRKNFAEVEIYIVIPPEKIRSCVQPISSYFPKGGELNYDIVQLFPNYTLSWEESLKLALSYIRIPFFRTALSKDFKSIIRFQTASLLPTGKIPFKFACPLRIDWCSSPLASCLTVQSSLTRTVELSKSINNFGCPLMLFNLAWAVVLKNSYLMKQVPHLRELLSYSDFSRGKVNQTVYNAVNNYLKTGHF